MLLCARFNKTLGTQFLWIHHSARQGKSSYEIMMYLVQKHSHKTWIHTKTQSYAADGEKGVSVGVFSEDQISVSGNLYFPFYLY